MSGVARLKKAKNAKAKRWKYIRDNKLRGAWGETDYNKKTIRINAKKSKTNPYFKRPVSKRSNKYPDVLGTIVHETLHKNHPQMYEKTVLKQERRRVAKMSKKGKKKMYSKIS